MLSISCLLNFTHSQTKALSSLSFSCNFFFLSNDNSLFSLILTPKLVLIIQLCVLLRQLFFFYSRSFSYPSAHLWPASLYSPHLAKHWWRENLGLEMSGSANILHTELLPALPISFSLEFPDDLCNLATSKCWQIIYAAVTGL